MKKAVQLYASSLKSPLLCLFQFHNIPDIVYCLLYPMVTESKGPNSCARAGGAASGAVDWHAPLPLAELPIKWKGPWRGGVRGPAFGAGGRISVVTELQLPK